MGEPTGPLPVITGQAALIAVTEQAIAEIGAVRELLRAEIGERPDPVPFVMLDRRLADLAGIIRQARRFELTRDILQAPPLAAVPEPRHRHRKGTARQRAPGEGQLRLFRVPSLVLVAFAALRGAVRAHRIAAALTAVTLGAPLAAGSAVIIHSATAQGAYGGQGPAPAASIEAAVPVELPSSSPAALLLTKPKARHGSKEGKTLLFGAVLPPPWSPAPGSSPASASPSASPSVSAAVGPAVLSVGATSLDLSNPLDPQASITLSASGSGWVSWRVDTTGYDLDFSATHGVLQAGQSYVLAVSVDPAQALDGNTSQTFSIGGQQVTVNLPLPVPASSVSPLPAASVPPSL
jgi:hypothetical protein